MVVITRSPGMVCRLIMTLAMAMALATTTVVVW